MGLLSFFKRRPDSAAKAPPVRDSAEAVQQARTRARQRLIGAVVLVGIGIIGFPLVFETQPRPIPVDIPIEIPRKDGAPPLVMPPARSVQPTAAASAARAPADDVITEAREDAGRELPVERPAAATAAASHAAADKPVPSDAGVKVPPHESVSKPAPSVEPARKPGPPADGARAQALLEGASAPRKEAGRYVVQIGAFADAAAARETRLKAEKLGLKTYTQVAETPGGSRVRVRLGPYAAREDADKARARVQAAGLTAVVLTL